MKSFRVDHFARSGASCWKSPSSSKRSAFVALVCLGMIIFFVTPASADDDYNNNHLPVVVGEELAAAPSSSSSLEAAAATATGTTMLASSKMVKPEDVANLKVRLQNKLRRITAKAAKSFAKVDRKDRRLVRHFKRDARALKRRIRQLRSRISRLRLKPGPNGPAGYPGPNGPAGHTGRPGPIGDAGPVGPPGPRGNQGKVGPIGPRGVSGPQGRRGPRGARGSAGRPGPQGPFGPPGPTGKAGPRGPRGGRGFPGRQGVTGRTGVQGSMGVRGPPGPRGFTGPMGLTGSRGDPGRRGPQGRPGRRGPMGPRGAPGARGFPGLQGPTGFPGGVGPRGLRGVRGQSGHRGPRGYRGFAGAQGHRGPRGSTGRAGRRGAPGPDGAAGPRGFRGRVVRVSGRRGGRRRGGRRRGRAGRGRRVRVRGGRRIRRRRRGRRIRRTRVVKKVVSKYKVKKGWSRPRLMFSARKSRWVSSDSSSHKDFKINFFRGKNGRGYCTKFVKSFGNVRNKKVCRHGKKKNIAYRMLTKFYSMHPGRWKFRVGGDFNRGGVVFLDGRELAKKTGATSYWNKDWTSSSVMTSQWVYLGKGNHNLNFIGFQKCCDRGATIQYRLQGSGGGWKTLNVRNLAQDTKKKIKNVPRPEWRSAKLSFATRQSSWSTQRTTATKEMFRQYYLSSRPNGYCSKRVSAFTMLNNGGQCGGPNSNLAYKFVAKFSSRAQSHWRYRVGGDFGRGGAIFLDGRMIGRRTGENLWWEYNWNSPSVMYSDWVVIGPGRHRLEVIGFEDCCDGKTSIQFQQKGGNWVDMTESALTTATKQGSFCGPNCQWLKDHPEAVKKLHLKKSWVKRLLHSRRWRKKFHVTRTAVRRIENRPTPPRRAVQRVVHRRNPCFPGAATVQLESGQTVRMEELKHGDRVLTLTNGMNAEYHDVFFFGHRENNVLEEFICLHLDSASGSSVCLTGDHYMVASSSGLWADAKFMRGRNVAVGMTAWRQQGSTMVPAKIVHIETRLMQGLYNPYTIANAIIVVDGVAASTHSAWFLDDLVADGWENALPYIYEKVLAPARGVYNIMGAKYAESLQARLPLDEMAQQKDSFYSVVAPYLALAAELPHIATTAISKI